MVSNPICTQAHSTNKTHVLHWMSLTYQGTIRYESSSFTFRNTKWISVSFFEFKYLFHAWLFCVKLLEFLIVCVCVYLLLHPAKLELQLSYSAVRVTYNDNIYIWKAKLPSWSSRSHFLYVHFPSQSHHCRITNNKITKNTQNFPTTLQLILWLQGTEQNGLFLGK